MPEDTLASQAEPAGVRPTPRWVHVLALVTMGMTFFLICAGGNVKSKGAGLAVPDWPFSYGQPFDRSPMVGTLLTCLAAGMLFLTLAWIFRRGRVLASGAILCALGVAAIFYLYGPQSFRADGTPTDERWWHMPNVRAEHGHRLIAGTVGLLMAVLAGALWQTERRRAVRKLGLIAFLAVVAQAVLGGVTVHMQLPPLVSASHGALAQAFFAMVVTLAVVTSPRWFGKTETLPQSGDQPGPARGASLQRLCVWTLAAVYLQVMLGTSVRHTHYTPGNGNGAEFAWHIGAHIAGFLFVCHTVARVAVRVIRRFAEVPALMRPVTALLVLLGVQMALGIGSLFFRLQDSTQWAQARLFYKEWTATSHVAVGALMVATAMVLTVTAFRRMAPSAALQPQAQAVEVSS